MQCPDPKFRDLKPQLRKTTFWDVHMDAIDYWRDDNYVIRKVFEHGTSDETLEVVVFYGKEHVIDVLTNTKFLREDAIFYAAGLLSIIPEDFQCYTTKRYLPNLSMS